MIHPDTNLRFISPELGLGVCASKMIPQGTILWVQDPLDIILKPEQLETLDPLLLRTIENHSFIDDQGRYVLCWDNGRYVNHSCVPTSVSIGKLCNIAARDIQCGEEITEDYATLNIANSLNCGCGTPLCRSIIQTKDLTIASQDLDAKAEEAMQHFLLVPQVLLSLLPKDRLALLLAVARGEQNLPSSLDNFFAIGETTVFTENDSRERGLWARS